MTPRSRLTRAARRLGLVGLLALAVPASAQADLLGTESASGCDSTSTPFAPWADYANYGLVPGGSFEPGMPSWSLAGGAEIVAGNEPFYVRGDDGKRSLLLPAGSSALSPTTCFEFGDWHARFFVRNAGATGVPEVDIVVRSLLGTLSVLGGGYVTAESAWQPSPRMSALVSNVGALLGTKAVAIRLRSNGSGAAFQVDDVYLDPFKSG